MDLLLILAVLAILIVLMILINRKLFLIEKFNNLQARVALYDYPHECPFDYINMYEDSLHNNKFIVESKLKNQPKELDNVFESVMDYRDSWDQLQHIFPNINKCGDPYEKYLDNMRIYYRQQKYVPYTHGTTTPLYGETFVGDTQIDLPSIYSNRNIDIRQLTRTVYNPSQLNTDRYMLPNTPNLDNNEQIDISVKPADERIPITYSEENIRLLKNQMVDQNFEQQRTYQKQILQMTAEIDQLRREIEALREQLIFEKNHFEDLDQSVEDKHQQIMVTNQTNLDLTKKIEELKKKSADMENLYLIADSQKNTLELRLQNLRKSMEEDIKNKGYTYLPPIYWTMNQWRPPICLSKDKTAACPIATDNKTGNYADVYGETSAHITPIVHVETSIDPIDSKN